MGREKIEQPSNFLHETRNKFYDLVHTLYTAYMIEISFTKQSLPVQGVIHCHLQFCATEKKLLYVQQLG